MVTMTITTAILVSVGSLFMGFLVCYTLMYEDEKDQNKQLRKEINQLKQEKEFFADENYDYMEDVA